MRAAVLGSGSWGTAFAKILGDAGTDVVLWARRPEVSAALRQHRHNPEYLPGMRLPEAVTATSDAAVAIDGADLVVLAIPSQTVRTNLAEWADLIDPEASLLSLPKGIELGTSKRMSEVIVEAAGVAPDRVVVLSGPNLAPEIAAEQPTASVVACTDPVRAAVVQKAVTTRYFRPYTNDDVVGCELGGAVKNVIALAYGMAHALGCSGAGSPRIPASRSRSAVMTSSVMAYRLAGVGAASAHFDRSSGGPATTVTGIRGRRFSRRPGRFPSRRGSNIRCGPHVTIGTTGAPVSRNSRATPVLPRCGHRSPAFGVVPSG